MQSKSNSPLDCIRKGLVFLLLILSILFATLEGYPYGVVPEWPKGTVCKTVFHRFESDRHLFEAVAYTVTAFFLHCPDELPSYMKTAFNPGCQSCLKAKCKSAISSIVIQGQYTWLDQRNNLHRFLLLRLFQD